MTSARKRPSAAMVVALTGALLALAALVLSLTGIATGLPGKNRIDRNDLRKNVVGFKNMRNNAIGGAEVRANALGGADINESSLGQVPSADTANTADSADSLGGLSLAKISYNAQANTGEQEIFHAGGLQINASCAGGATIVADATPDANDAKIHVVATENSPSFDSPSGDENDDAQAGFGRENGDSTQGFDVGEEVSLFPDTPLGTGIGNEVEGNLTFRAANGTVVTVQYMAEQEVNINPDRCHIYGHAVIG